MSQILLAVQSFDHATAHSFAVALIHPAVITQPRRHRPRSFAVLNARIVLFTVATLFYTSAFDASVVYEAVVVGYFWQLDQSAAVEGQHAQSRLLHDVIRSRLAFASAINISLNGLNHVHVSRHWRWRKAKAGTLLSCCIHCCAFCSFCTYVHFSISTHLLKKRICPCNATVGHFAL